MLRQEDQNAYSKRLRIVVFFCVIFLSVCIFRLVTLQLISRPTYVAEIEDLKGGTSKLLKTVRGRILDRKGRVAACDEPKFLLCVNYGFCSALDERCRAANQTEKQRKERIEEANEIIAKIAEFGKVSGEEVRRQIAARNNEMWKVRTFQAWRAYAKDSQLLEKYKKVENIPFSEALADFEEKVPDGEKRRAMINKVEVTEMYEPVPVVELKDSADVMDAQVEFVDTKDVEVVSRLVRVYPYGTAAAQTIGWVGGVTESLKLATDDEFFEYMPGEVCGKEGVEYVCEGILRGRRGREVYDFDRKFISRTESEFGGDVQLTIDIELQKRIEEYLGRHRYAEYCTGGVGVVVIEVSKGEILAIASLPTFDLNLARYKYGELVQDGNKPLLNRVLAGQYPPGSVIKPVIMIAGLESGKISAEEVISCPQRSAPAGWPNCLAMKQGNCHDWRWANEGGNSAHNAMRGSCNVYFSRLADRIEPAVLQNWLYRFGYGQKILDLPAVIEGTEFSRKMRQAVGVISDDAGGGTGGEGEQLGSLRAAERKYFGIGQGSLRVTCLQVASALAAIARGGVYKRPLLYVEKEGTKSEEVGLNISPETLRVVKGGMWGVVNETGGTAYRAFAGSGFAASGVKVYGKTGSTQDPAHAWFGGFAEDGAGRGVVLALVVEGGESGGGDAAPLA